MVILALAGAAGCSDDDEMASGCTLDTQCKGERICSVDRRCVYPDQISEPDEDANGDAGTSDAQTSDVQSSDADARDAEDADTRDAQNTDTQNTDDQDVSDADHRDTNADASPGADASDADLIDADAGHVPETCDDFPNVAICVELSWEALSDLDPTDTVGPDVDLHYLHPLGRWNNAPYDVFWENTTADWNNDGQTGGDPSLEFDSTDGAASEVIVHDNPVDGENYSVGVYYYNDRGMGGAYAEIKVFADGNPIYQPTSGHYLPATGAFVEVGAIAWPSAQFTEIGTRTDDFP